MNRITEQRGDEIFFAGDAGEGGLMAPGVLFPKGEVIDVSLAVTAQGCRLDAVRMT